MTIEFIEQNYPDIPVVFADMAATSPVGTLKHSRQNKYRFFPETNNGLDFYELKTIMEKLWALNNNVA